LSHHIEEDFRFATATEVLNYPIADLIWKPHMWGFELSQLLDQVDGQVISRNKAGHKFQGLVRAPGGTALCLAKHLSANESENELLIITEVECTTSLLLAELNELDNVIVATTDASEVLPHLDNYSVNCSILACYEGLADQYRSVKDCPQLRRKAIIAYDPDSQLIQEGGRYFMNSATWVRDEL